MTAPRIVHDGILYRNPAPGHVAICAFYPSLVSIGINDILCVYRRGQAIYSNDGQIAKLRSADGGATWKSDGVLWNRHDEKCGEKFSYMAPFISRLSDGTLAIIVKRSLAEVIDVEMFNPVTGGNKPSELVLTTSRDGGRTWSPPRVLDLPDGDVLSSHTSVIDLDDGRWMMCFEKWKRWDDTRPLHIHGFAMFSKDQGATWGGRLDFPSASDAERMFSHSQYRKRRDGGIWALQWTQSIGGNENHDLHLVTADKSGKTWSSPVPTGLRGQTSCIADLGEGRAVATYVAREGMRPGVMVVASDDDGRTWDVEHQTMVWDAVGQEFLGVVHKPSYPSSHDNIAFGKPDLIMLPDGDVIASWWCTQACVTHIRYARLSLK